MSILSPKSTDTTTVAIGPTETTIATYDTRFDKQIAVQITNLDAVQTFSGLIYIRQESDQTWALTTFSAELDSVNPLESHLVVIPTLAVGQVQIRGIMSDGGGNVSITSRRSST